ncbi:MAG: DsbE family thiol:disulfide interchange protein [Cellvibrionaceae bacterium]
MSRLKLFIPLIVFVALAFMFFKALKIDPTELPSVLIGRSVPDFTLSTVKDTDRQVTVTDLKGHGFSLINIWATWCGPCRQEHPFLIDLSKEGISIFGVNSQDDLKLARRWLDERGDPYVFSAFDSEGRLGLDLGVYGYPETFLIDDNGMVLYRHTGVLSKKSWDEKFLPLIQSKK